MLNYYIELNYESADTKASIANNTQYYFSFCIVEYSAPLFA
jgi:hypothetical protein